ncbi:sulfite reductase subunit alpha [Shimia sp. R9_1]|uniref:sulfite reductase subunit alpha n=1 Tax=Shimia sp. R9_1 TaxID=2821111 RepID=UPI001ADB23DA|nr:sulfite reductase subunit alpha [Shimia sp. R9_1]MBO9409598.1 sulfite reductase subunit alpha [Shimia sp. R9_1]
MNAPYIPDDAPFSGEQRSWLGGFLAGLHSRLSMGGVAGVAPAEEQVKAKPLNILFGTQTGNAEEVANEAAELAKNKGFAPKVAELDAIEMDQLAAMENVIVVISTYGEGEMPDNAELFWEALSAGTAPRLEKLNYGVLALGDTSYELFCQAGKLIDTRLEQLGAKRLGARVDCDIDFEDAASAWLTVTIPDAGSAGASETNAVAPKPQKSGFSRKNPYVSKVVDNHIQSGAQSAKEIRHIAFDLGDSCMTYEAGDALGVIPVNAPDLVDGILTRLGVSQDTYVDGKDQPLGALLATGVEIMTPSRDLIRALEPLAKHDEFSHVVGNGDKEALEAFLWGKDTLDLLNLNPDLAIDVNEFVSWLKPLQHRAYSISSSPKAHPGEVHLTVAAVRWTYNHRVHNGVCSTFLADHVLEGAEARIFMSPNKSFRVPQDNDVPMIMVGPGTGIAPFRAFLEERRELGAKGANWLFFGDQHRESDFIYEDEISAMSASGLLTRLDLAFSRDQAEKIYVQNRMLENGKELFGMLQEGGHFYVCGDATRMAKDVDQTLHQVIELHGGLSADEATEYVSSLKREKRYVRDVY